MTPAGKSWSRVMRHLARRLSGRRRRTVSLPSTGGPAAVVNGYLLALGREAEPEIVAVRAAQPLAELVASLLASTEFARTVTEPLLAGGPVAVERPIPTSGLLAWIAAALPLSPAGVAAAAGSPTWRRLLWLVLSDPAVQAWLTQVAPGGPLPAWHDPAFLARLDALSSGPAAGIVGILDPSDGVVVTGWALDVFTPDRPLRIAVEVDGAMLAETEARTMRPEIRDGHGLPERCGFRVDLAAARLYRRPGPVRLRLRAVVTGVLVAERPLMSAGGHPLEDYAAYRRLVGAIDRSSIPPVGGTALRFGLVLSAGRGMAVDRGVVSQRGGWPVTSVVIPPEDRRGDAAAERLDAAARRAGGDVLIFADDVVLEPDLLDQVAAVLLADPAAALVYWDEDRIDDLALAASSRAAPWLKPPFDPVWLLQRNYVGTTFAVRRSAFDAVGGFGGGVDGGGHHDLLLRLAAHVGRGGVRHIARVLHGVVAPNVAGRQPDSHAPSRAAAAAALRRQRWPAVAERSPGAPVLRLRPDRATGTRAAVVIASRDQPALLSACVAALLASRASNWTPFTVTVVDHASVLPATAALLDRLRDQGVTVRRCEGLFNWAAINNAGAAGQDADVLVFLNDDTLVRSPSWCDELCLHAARAEVGAVGTLLLYPDGTVQHAGMLVHGDGSAPHEGLGLPADDAGYLGRLAVAREVTAVTGACLATRRSVFEQLDGFDASRFPVTFNDVDYCLRAREAGLVIRYTPHASFLHLESKSRGFDLSPERRARQERERQAFLERWPALPALDPHYNPHFARDAPPHRRLAASVVGDA